MSEFMESHSVSRLLGAPPGYVGHDEGGVLTNAVRERAYRVVLLDEVEKAHRDVLNVLLQVLDDGRLTDGQGRTVDFRNTVIIMTSNIGSPLIQEYYSAGKATDEVLRNDVMNELKRHFRPEFLNRVDDSIIFRSLDESELGAIVDIQLSRVEDRLEDQQLTLAVDSSARQFLAKAGYDPQFGARPLKRAIQQHLLDPLALKLLDGGFKPGDSISAKAKADEVEFSLAE